MSPPYYLLIDFVKVKNLRIKGWCAILIFELSQANFLSHTYVYAYVQVLCVPLLASGYHYRSDV